jgi:hypothetical protein
MTYIRYIHNAIHIAYKHNRVMTRVRLVEEQSLRRYQRVTFKKSQGRLAELWDKYEAKTIKTSVYQYINTSLYKRVMTYIRYIHNAIHMI